MWDEELEEINEWLGVKQYLKHVKNLTEEEINIQMKLFHYYQLTK